MEEQIEIKNAIIQDTGMRIERGLLTAYLYVDYGGLGQGFGGYCLYLPQNFKHHEINSVAGHFIYKCLKIADVESWADLKGKTIRVKCTWNKIYEIGHIVKDEWFNPEKDFKDIVDKKK